MVADYYAMLGVEPSAGRGAIEAALAKAQPLWSAGTRNPKNKHTFQSYLDQIPAIRRTLLGDPALRAAYDAELAAVRRAERDRALDRLQRLVRIRAAKGGLTVSDRALLKGEAATLGVDAAELERLLAPYPPMPEAPAEAEAPEPLADVIDPATRRQIRIALEHLRRSDLYDVLGLPRDAPASEIAAKADAERQRWMQKSQVTAEKTAWLEAVSYAQSHLASPEARARYDRTLAAEAEEALGETIGFAIKGTTALAAATRRFLREEALTLGITAERADRLIDRACRAAGVARDGGGETAAPVGLVRYLRCRSCAGLTEFALASRSPDSAECRHCRAPLQWKCPACQRVRWVDEPRCACGFRQEDVEPLVRYFEAANHAHRVRDYEAALAALRRVQDFAPQHVGARKGIEKIKEALARIESLRATFDLERSRRHLIAARTALAAWARLVDPSSTDLRKAMHEVTTELREAQYLVAQARMVAATDPAAARAGFRRALEIAADLPDARDGLRLCPPEPPTALRAEIVSDRVRLRWTAPPARRPGALRLPGGPQAGRRAGARRGRRGRGRGRPLRVRRCHRHPRRHRGVRRLQHEVGHRLAGGRVGRTPADPGRRERPAGRGREPRGRPVVDPPAEQRGGPGGADARRRPHRPAGRGARGVPEGPGDRPGAGRRPRVPLRRVRRVPHQRRPVHRLARGVRLGHAHHADRHGGGGDPDPPRRRPGADRLDAPGAGQGPRPAHHAPGPARARGPDRPQGRRGPGGELAGPHRRRPRPGPPTARDGGSAITPP